MDDRLLHQAKYPLPARIVPKLTPVDKADEAVDIRDILNQMNVWTPEGMFFSYKIDCPWNYEHSDGGRDKNCRLFGKTNFYCWALHGFITPTLLYSRWKSIPREKAAEILLEERGLVKKPWRETWNELMQDREDSSHDTLGSKQDVVTALHEILNSDFVYLEQEFHPLVRSKWTQSLAILDAIWEMPDIGLTELQTYYDKSLTAIKQAARLAQDTE